jgi:hypothetical protein
MGVMNKHLPNYGRGGSNLVEQVQDVHKVLVYKKFSHQNLKASCLMNTQSNTNFQQMNNIDLKLQACCAHKRKKP